MTYQWAVVGAGPAGIAAVGKLIDAGVKPAEIAWIDPQFQVGDFGTIWTNVPSNTKVDLFLKFLESSAAFDFQNAPKNFALLQTPRDKTCPLGLMSETLQWVTEQLKNKVHVVQDLAEKLALRNRVWNITLKNSEIKARSVILAVGAEAKNLSYSSPAIIPMHDAMDSERIKNHIEPNDTIAVFGSSHSAVLVLKNLVESGAKKIINFYRSPLLYAVYLDDWILFDDSGLKGSAAEWARNHLDGDVPQNLTRVYSNNENIEHYLPQCQKVVYAVGFERRTLPIIEDVGHLDYMKESGIIAPGLFGFGIAYPEAKYNRLGMLEYRVGLWKFMDYLQRILPIWFKYSP